MGNGRTYGGSPVVKGTLRGRSVVAGARGVIGGGRVGDAVILFACVSRSKSACSKYGSSFSPSCNPKFVSCRPKGPNSSVK